MSSSRQISDSALVSGPRLGNGFLGRLRGHPPHTEFDDAIIRPSWVEVRHVGGRHADDSTVVAVPDSGVLLLGDCFYPPPLHLREPHDGYDGALIGALLDKTIFGRYEWYVDSHNHPRSPQAMRELLSSA